MSHFPFAVAAWLFVIGLYGIVTSRNLIHLVMCMTVVQAGTYVLLIAVGFRTRGHAPLYNEIPSGTPIVDPVSHALILTDLVVGATVTALLLAMAVQVHRQTRTLDPAALRPLRD